MQLTYAKWQYWIYRKWQTSVKNKYQLVGFATMVASFGKDGANCHPKNVTLQMAGNVSEPTVKRLRRQCIRLGLFTVTGNTPYGVPILEISIPADDTEPLPPGCSDPGSCGCKDCTEWRVRYVAYFDAQKRRASETAEAKRVADDDLWMDSPPW